MTAEDYIERCQIISGVGEGWYPLVESAGRILDQIFGEDNWVPDQIKEKFGQLRFYYSVKTGMPKERLKVARRLISAIEAASAYVYEKEGGPGEIREEQLSMRTVPVNLETHIL